MFIKVNFMYLFFEWDSAGSENNLRRKRVPDRDYTMIEKPILIYLFIYLFMLSLVRNSMSYTMIVGVNQ